MPHHLPFGVEVWIFGGGERPCRVYFFELSECSERTMASGVPEWVFIWARKAGHTGDMIVSEEHSRLTRATIVDEVDYKAHKRYQEDLELRTWGRKKRNGNR